MFAYEDNTRGAIQYPELAKQLIDFSELKWGRITPTDIDGIVEYQNVAYILYEFKYGNASVPHGQEICLMRMCDDFTASGKLAVLLVCEHNIRAPTTIKASQAIVRDIYYDGSWRDWYKGQTVLYVSNRVFNKAKQILREKRW